METVAHTYHQVIGILETIELIADMKKETPCEMYFQSQHLIEILGIRVAKQIVAHTGINRENRHHKLSASRKPPRNLMEKRRTIEFHLVPVSPFNPIAPDVRTLVILHIERDTRPQKRRLKLYIGAKLRPAIPK